jgi:NAD(P)-dependent dehydrogenase (short-subunit alcohol dehydrogenase family)
MKTIIITGASRGIGAATAILAAQQGYKVCVNYNKSPDRAAQVVQEISDAGQAFVCQADMAVEADIIKMFDQVEERWGRVDALVNNAGVLEKQCALADVTLERLERLFRVNAIGAILCCREAARRMTEGGAIVNVSSVASRLGSAGEYVDYAATKGAMDSLTIGLSKELGPQKIRVNAVRPGFIRTEIHADGGEAGRPDRIGPNLPLRKAGESDEVAQAILWLLSDEASYVTGSFLEMGGGV